MKTIIYYNFETEGTRARQWTWDQCESCDMIQLFPTGLSETRLKKNPRWFLYINDITTDTLFSLNLYTMISMLKVCYRNQNISNVVALHANM